MKDLPNGTKAYRNVRRPTKTTEGEIPSDTVGEINDHLRKHKDEVIVDYGEKGIAYIPTDQLVPVDPTYSVGEKFVPRPVKPK